MVVSSKKIGNIFLWVFYIHSYNLDFMMSKIIGNNWIKSSFLKTKKLPHIKCSHNYLHWHWLTHIVGQVTGVWHDIAARLWPTYLCKLSHTATAGCLHFVAFELSGGLSQCKRKQWRVEQRARHTVVSSTLTKFEQSLPHDTWYIMSHTHMIHNVSDIGQQKKTELSEHITPQPHLCSLSRPLVNWFCWREI